MCVCVGDSNRRPVCCASCVSRNASMNRLFRCLFVVDWRGFYFPSNRFDVFHSNFLVFFSCAPPPPPILANGSIPARRLQTSVQPEMPSCVQNAMMTKDKKPFTYTPCGIDLSQIKSPRMAKRLQRNADMEGVTNQPKPSPLAQVTDSETIHNNFLNE